MNKKNENKLKYSLFDLEQICLKYYKISDFKKNNPKEFRVAKRRGLLETITTHMTNDLRTRRGIIWNTRWSYELLKEEALKYETRIEFKNKNKSAYSAALERNILDEICSHMEYLAYPWTEKELEEEAKKYDTRSDFSQNNGAAYSSATRKGILDRICSHMNPIFHKDYTHEELMLEAKKYTTRAEFMDKNISAWKAAYRRGILEEICSHMRLLKRLPYTYEELKDISSKYDTRSVFQEKEPGAYSSAQDKDILDDICINMKRPSNTSRPEKELFDILSKIIPNAQKLRVRKIQIHGRPYIKGFDIDILFPKLNLGIELDGTYWHSFKAMRNCSYKKSWPDEAITNYHQIKDNYFWEQKGIRILHIKEEDWTKDKESCIVRCLRFINFYQERKIQSFP